MTTSAGIVIGALLYASYSFAQGITVSPSLYDFGNSPVNTIVAEDGHPMTVLRITNNTSQTVTISVSATGDTEDFSFFLIGANQVGCEFTTTLPPGPGGCASLGVFFTPHLLAQRSLTITITSNVQSEPLTAVITGTGIVSTFGVVNSISAKFLDVPGGSTANGALIQQWDWNGLRQQSWSLISAGNSYYAIMNSLTGKVLDDPGATTADGALIQQWAPNGGPQQYWQLAPADNVHYQIINAASRNALDNSNASSLNGNFIQQWEPNSFGQQLWALIPAGTYQILSYNSNLPNALLGKALDVTNGSTQNGAPIQQWTSNGFGQQQWLFIPTGDGYYAIMNALTHKVLDVTNATASNGTPIQQWDYDGGWQQQWKLELRGECVFCGGGNFVYFDYTVRSRLNNQMVLDVRNASLADGAPIQIWQSNGSYQQRWVIRRSQN